MKLMDIDQEHLGIPDTQYDATITFSSTEFARICRDLSALGESVKIEVDKQGIRFSSDGEIGNGSVLLKHSAGRGGAPGGGNARGEVKPKLKKETKRDPDDEEGSDVEQDDEEDIKPDVDEEEVKPDVDEDDEEYAAEEEEPEVVEPKKRKAPAKKEANGRAKKVSLTVTNKRSRLTPPPGKRRRGRRRSRRQHHPPAIRLAHILAQVPAQLCQIRPALQDGHAEHEQRSAATRRVRV